MHLTQRTPHGGEVLGKGAYWAAIYQTISSNNSLCGNDNFIHAKVSGSMLNKQIKLVKAVMVKKQLEPLTSSQLSRFVLFFHTLRTSQSLHLSFSVYQFFQAVNIHVHVSPLQK
jgi:hypothetical protein